MSVISGYNCSQEEAAICEACSQAIDDSYVIKLLNETMGPQTLPPNILNPMTTIYVLMFLTGVIGNLAVCIVIIHNRSMHTATNYYLFSLAIADLLILLLGLPFELIGFWSQYPTLLGPAFCKIRSYVSEWTSYASVLTIVAFSTERYLAICHPLYILPYDDLPRVLRVNSVSWTVAGIAALPFLFLTSVTFLIDYQGMPLPNPNSTCPAVLESATCALTDTKGIPLYQLSMVLFFLIPVGILMFLYISMGLELHRAVMSHGSVHGGNAASKKQIIRMLGIVVLSFFVCWAPFHAQRLGYIYFGGLDTSIPGNLILVETFYDVNETLMFVSGITYYLSSTINPILYNLMSAKYRDAFRNTFCGPCFKGQGSDRNKSMYESRASRAGPGYTAVTQITSTKMAATKLHAKLDKNRTGITGSPRLLNNGDDISRSPSDLLMPKSSSRKVSFEDTRSPDHLEMSKGCSSNELKPTAENGISKNSLSTKDTEKDGEHNSCVIVAGLSNDSCDDKTKLSGVDTTAENSVMTNNIELKSICTKHNDESTGNESNQLSSHLSHTNSDTLHNTTTNTHNKENGHITHDEIKSSQDGNSVPKNSWSENRIQEKEGIEMCQINEICTVKIDIHKSTIKLSASEYLSSESVPGSHDISYIDDGPKQVLNLVEPQCKSDENGIGTSKEPVVANCGTVDSDGDQDMADETVLDSEVHKFHEVVIKNQSSVSNFLDVLKAGGDPINGEKGNLKSGKQRSASTRSPKHQGQEKGGEARRRSLQPEIS